MLAVAIPVVAFAEAWNVDHPLWQVIVKGRVDGLSVALLVLCALAVAPIVNAWALKDYEFLFGAATIAVALLAVFASLTALMPWISFSAAAGARWFAVLLVCWLVALAMVAFDWVRKDLILASVVTVIALGSFIARAGYNDLRAMEQRGRSDTIAAAASAKKQLDAQADAAPATLVGNANAARQDLVNVVFEVLPPNVPAPLRQAALQIYSKTPTTYDQPVNPALVANFDALAANQPANTAEVVTGLRLKTHAFVDAVNAAAARFTSPVAVLSGQLQNALVTARRDLDKASWPADSHDLTVALAAYRAAVTGTDADKQAYQAAQSAALPAAGAGFGVLQAVTDGPQALWAGAMKKNLRPLVPGPLGWVLLGGLALGIWGALLRQNAMQLAGPVSVQGDAKDDKLTAVLRVAVLRNLDEPGAAPGASASNPVTNLIDAVSGPLTQIGKILDVVYKVAGRRYGYEVTTDISADTSTAAPVTTVLVKLKSIAGDQTFATRVFERETDEQAVRTAGLWAAGKILERSTRIPTWAAWNAYTAEALSTAFLEAPTTEQLEEAVKQAPGSGLLLAMLGQAYESAPGRRVDAVEMYARAVAAHPRYLVARYRLGAALAAMRDDLTWTQLQRPERERALRSVQRAAEALHISVTQLAGPPANPTPQPAYFMALARAFLHELRVDTRLWHRLVSAIRRSERDAVAPVRLIRWSDPDARFHPLVKSLCIAYAEDFRGDRLVGYASRPRRWWQVSYNAACGLAVHEQPDKAFLMLEQALIKPGVEQLSADWVNKDVDLASLRGDARFADFVQQLRTGA